MFIGVHLGTGLAAGYFWGQPRGERLADFDRAVTRGIFLMMGILFSFFNSFYDDYSRGEDLAGL